MAIGAREAGVHAAGEQVAIRIGGALHPELRSVRGGAARRRTRGAGGRRVDGDEGIEQVPFIEATGLARASEPQLSSFQKVVVEFTESGEFGVANTEVRR